MWVSPRDAIEDIELKFLYNNKWSMVHHGTTFYIERKIEINIDKGKNDFEFFCTSWKNYIINIY